METTDNLGLVVWDLLSDRFNHTQLTDNFNRIDLHDHTADKGKQIPSAGLASNAVTADKIAPAAVGAAALADGTVSSTKLADAAITGAKLADNTVTTAKLAPAAVTGAKIAAASVTPDKLAPPVLLTTMPSVASVTNGQEIYFQTATMRSQVNTTYVPPLHLRFNSQRTVYRWDVIGAPTYFQRVTGATLINITTSPGQQSVLAPSLIVSNVGLYEVTFGAQFTKLDEGTSRGNIKLRVGANTSTFYTQTTDCATDLGPAIGSQVQVTSHATIELTAINPLRLIMDWGMGGGTIRVDSPFIMARPIILD
jgi:hypothetical protein